MLKYIELKCEVCNNNFLRYEKLHEKNVKNNKKIFCSKSCSSKGNCRASHDIQKNKYKNNFEERFWSRVEKTENCWNWTGLVLQGRKYGVCKQLGKNRTVHRISYELANKLDWGSLSATECVLHKCDNPLCVNPEHLFLGTHKDNIKDMIDKNRNSKGEKIHSCKLSNEQVLQIRASKKTKKELAFLFNVSQHTIYSIKSRKTWKHI